MSMVHSRTLGVTFAKFRMPVNQPMRRGTGDTFGNTDRAALGIPALRWAATTLNSKVGAESLQRVFVPSHR
jgi:hypothetical protein